MKRIISILLVLTFILIFSSCNKKEDDKGEDRVSIRIEKTIEISEESKAVRDNYFLAYDLKNISHEQEEADFENAIEGFKDRTTQVMPDVETTNEIIDEGNDVYSLSNGSYEKIVLYIHGGAWMYEIEELHVKYCDLLVENLNAKVYIPLYPLLPNATNEDVYEYLMPIYQDLLKLGKPIIIMGDSAGGTITLGLTLKLKDEGITLPDKVVVMAPCADATFSNKEIDEYEKNDGMLPRYLCTEAAKLWAGDTDINDPYVSPLSGDYHGFPDTLMFVGTYDILCADDLLLYNKMVNSSVYASLVKGEGFWHVFPIFNIPEKEQCLEIIKDFCK